MEGFRSGQLVSERRSSDLPKRGSSVMTDRVPSGQNVAAQAPGLALLSVYQVVLNGNGHSLRAAFSAEFGEDVADVKFDGGAANVQALGDGRVA